MLLQSFVAVPLAGVLALLLAHRGLGQIERRYVSYAFVAHIVGSIALVLYHEFVFRGGDMYLYTSFGSELARYVRYDPIGNAPEAIKLTLQMEAHLPMSVLLEGTSTSTMMGLTSLIMLVFGDSIYAACLAYSFFSFLGTAWIYNAVRFKLEPVERVPVLIGVLLVPSVVFWSSGIVKEAVVLGALGTILRGISEILVRRRVWAVITMLPAAGLMMLIKPYVSVPLVLGLGAWFYAGRGQKVALGYKLIGVAIAVGGLIAVTRLFPAYGFDRVAETLAHTQRNFAQANQGAGSAIQIGDLETDLEEQTLASSLKWAPLGLLNALARPMLFDVRNVTMAVAAVEMTVLLAILVGLVRRHGVGRVIREVASQPPFLFSGVFVLALGTSVGLATANLGSLSRYRVPMMPMYVGSVLALRARLDVRARQRATHQLPAGHVRGASLALHGRAKVASRGPLAKRTRP